MLGAWCNSKLQALVYDILSSRKVPESDARSVVQQQTPSTGLRHLSFKESAGKRCLECAQGIGAVWVAWGTDRKLIYIWLFVDCIVIGWLLLFVYCCCCFGLLFFGFCVCVCVLPVFLLLFLCLLLLFYINFYWCNLLVHVFSMIIVRSV